MKTILFLALIAVNLVAQLLDPDYSKGLERYLLDHTFRVDGRFYYYTKSEPPRWILEILSEEGEPARYYTLFGREPTEENPFGWVEESFDLSYLKGLEPAGYFIHINYGKESSPALSWIYVDRERGEIYKLIGISGGEFHYLGPLNVKFALFKNRVYFFNRGDRLQYNSGTDILLERYSTDSPYLRFDPRYLKEGRDFTLLTDLNVSSITISQEAFGRVGKEVVEGAIEKLPLQGVVKIRSRVGDFTVNCTEYYKPVEIDHLPHGGKEVEELLERWGEGGPCSKELIRTTCPAEYYDRLVGCGEKFDLSTLSKNVDFATLTTYTINNDLNYRVRVYERTKIEAEHE
ncbi:MAG: hypothetical protein GXO19_07220 [Epsilonproteobacteria bacterium]|nr:hypothetical protein [Campylobacterota bacterium]NPA57505.1 hypothetical protein [Campylobacterota bacterium]